jgi:hypothetical protein
MLWGLQKSSQFSETEAGMTGCGGHLLGRGCTLSRLIGLLPLLQQKTTARVKCMKKENGISFSSGSKHIYIYIRHLGLNTFVDCKGTGNGRLLIEVFYISSA